MSLDSNIFKSTTIKGNLYNKDYNDGSFLANAIFDRNLQVKKSLVLGDDSGTALPTLSYYDMSGNLHNISLGASNGYLGWIDQLNNIYNQID